MSMPRERIDGLLGESKKALDAEHGALRSEVESGIDAIKRGQATGGAQGGS
ncbi:MAG: hypothetical protein OXD41_04880 [Thaumarchaeota archaeon]|nr:hypothetical protein [Nitrososphaerota archaeon]